MEVSALAGAESTARAKQVRAARFGRRRVEVVVRGLVGGLLLVRVPGRASAAGRSVTQTAADDRQGAEHSWRWFDHSLLLGKSREERREQHQ